jgi:diadenylate cyclase
VSSGIEINAKMSKDLLENIFFKNSPLHDGAVLIVDNKIKAARCVLPLTEQEIDGNYGMRHRAALGISENSDCLAIIVSEETGEISFAVNSKFINQIEPAKVESELRLNLN